MDTLTVGDLKKALANIDDNVIVLYQRIEDVYFTAHGWNDHSKKLLFDCYGQYHFQFDENNKVVCDEEGNPVKVKEHCGECYSEYIPVFSAYKHPEDNAFVLNAHY
jgi:hypothetical protein